MPALTIKEFSPLVSHFITHWSDVNTALTPHPFVLRTGYTVDQLGDDRRVFEESQSAIATAEGPLVLASGQRTALRQGLRERIRQFRGAVVGEFPEIAAGRVPTIPVLTASDSVWDSTLGDIVALWTELNATTLPGFTPPLVLVGGYTVAQLAADKAELLYVAHTLKEGEQTPKTLRKTRDAHVKGVYQNLVRYRKAILNRFPADHPLITSLPEL